MIRNVSSPARILLTSVDTERADADLGLARRLKTNAADLTPTRLSKGKPWYHAASAASLQSKSSFSSSMENWLTNMSVGATAFDYPPGPEPDVFSTFALTLEGSTGYASSPQRPLTAALESLPPAAAAACRSLSEAFSASDFRDAAATLAGLQQLAKQLRAASAQAASGSAAAAVRSQAAAAASSGVAALGVVELRRHLDDYASSQLMMTSAVDAVLRIIRLPPGWSGCDDGDQLEAAVLDCAAEVVASL